MDIRTTLTERGSTHGDFSDNAYIAQSIKAILKEGPHWGKRTDIEKEAMEMIAHKLARWVSCSAFNIENPHDISGYATLVEDRMQPKTDNEAM